MSDKLDLNLLNVFLEVYRLQSITLASEALDMTQPGVSGALKRLQQQVGTQLFVREGRGISPTHAAIQLAQSVEPALQNVHSAIGNLQDFDINQPRVFHVLVNELMLLLLQPKVEQDTNLGQVQIQFSLTPSDEESLLNDLSLQKADLAIDVGDLRHPSYLSQSVHKDDLVLIARRSHPRIQGTLTAKEFYQERHVTIRIRRSNQYAADYFTSESLQTRAISAECDSLMSMLALISQTDCIGATTLHIANQYADLFGLQVLPPPFDTLDIEQHMIWHKKNQHHPAHHWLTSKISSYLTN